MLLVISWSLLVLKGINVMVSKRPIFVNAGLVCFFVVAISRSIVILFCR